jgi:tetratricopeptide (TPR) repeat protein
MDRLDRISIWVIVLLIISSFALISRHMGEARPDRKVQQRIAAADSPVANDEVVNKVKLIKNLMEADNLNKAELLIKELIQKYPYEGEPRMLMGDIFMRRQEPVKAMHEYKEAIDLNPDYLDKKTPLFQGKKLKIAVGEALAEIEKRIRLNPGDESMKSDRKVIYYFYRRIAGSCG